MDISIYIDLIINFIALLATSIAIFTFLRYANIKWAMTSFYAQVIFILPIITFVITKVISGNVALSLGMVGALSVIRFRTPIKNPFELTILFLLISLGITYSVELKWGIFLGCASLLVLIIVNLVVNFSNKFSKNYFQASFPDANTNSVLELYSSKQLADIDFAKLITYTYDVAAGTHAYRISYDDKQHALDAIAKFSVGDSILKVQLL